MIGEKLLNMCEIHIMELRQFGWSFLGKCMEFWLTPKSSILLKIFTKSSIILKQMATCINFFFIWASYLGGQGTNPGTDTRARGRALSNSAGLGADPWDKLKKLSDVWVSQPHSSTGKLQQSTTSDLYPVLPKSWVRGWSHAVCEPPTPRLRRNQRGTQAFLKHLVYLE